MTTSHRLALAAGALLLAMSAPATADIKTVARCQKKIAAAGANFAKRVIVATLKCTEEIAECQVQCEQGVFGPPCENNPPPCCDPDDPGSNAAFGECMDEADEYCAKQDLKIASYEESKQGKITAACTALAQEELCGATGNGLNFAHVNAGCLALDPEYTCTLPNLIECLGGPLQRKLLDQISGLLSPRASDAVLAGGLQSAFPDLPVTRKVKEDLPAAGKLDLWSLTGQAGDKIVVRIKTRDDTGSDQSTLQPTLAFLDAGGITAVPDTTLNSVQCSVPNACGTGCPQFERVLPFNGTYVLQVGAGSAAGCDAGGYRLIVTAPAGTALALAADDVDP